MLWQKQCDVRWKNTPYECGDNRTICSDGCGPAAIANMLNEPIPDVIATSLRVGGKALYSGTYYGAIGRILYKYGVMSRQLNNHSIYNTPQSQHHGEALQHLKQGKYVIACLGKSKWTTSGHYVLLYGCDSNNIFINDSYNSGTKYEVADYDTLFRAVKYYFLVEYPLESEDEIMKKTVLLNGKPIQVDTIERDNRLFIKIADLNTEDLKVSYENDKVTLRTR